MTGLERPRLTARNKGKVKMLERRAEHLRMRIAETPPDLRGLDYDKGELAALKFALSTIAKHYDCEDRQ